MKIGVFDSGVGGLSVANAIETALPEHEIIYVTDVEHVPYGTKPAAEILGYVEPILRGLAGQGCGIIVIACNTVSTTLITELRAVIPVPLIAMEPMVKPAAALTKSGTIAVCATPTTLRSARYAWLKETYAPDLKVIEPDCSNWSYMIEHKQVDEKQIEASIETAIAGGADVIVLACTHYHWIEKEIQQIAGHRARVIQPEQAVITELKRQIDDLGA
jgi:glutamate racemase